MNDNVKEFIELVNGEQVPKTVSKKVKLITYSVEGGKLNIEYDVVFKKYKFFIKNGEKVKYRTFINYKIKKIVRKIPSCKLKRKELKQ